MTQPTLYALLVGINRYASPQVPDLGGSVNDVTAMAQLLTARFAVPPAQIQILTDTDATTSAVRAAFQAHLIASARAWAAADRQGEPPALLFHFSGHGSQAPDPTGTEADGLDETLVCHDSRLPDHYDLKDWELGLLLDEAARYTHNITVILDCCHSGGGTRTGTTTKTIAQTRGCAIDRRPQPARPDAMRPDASATRSMVVPARSHWARGGAHHVLLAACRDKELAHEHRFDTPAGHLPHGVLTHTLVQLLLGMDDNHPLTYYELHEQLTAGVRALYQAQNPQCEGDWGRQIFGGLRPTRDLWLRVVEIEGEALWIDGGMVQRLAQGDQLWVYPPTARTVAEAGAPLATLEVVRSEATRSLCRVLAGDVAIPLAARVVIAAPALGESRRTVALIMASGMNSDAIRARLAQNDLVGLLELRPATASADLRLLLDGDRLELQDGAGQRLFRHYSLRDLNRARRPLRAADLNRVAADLQLIVQAQLLATLQNPHSTLAGVIALGLKQLILDATTGEARSAELATSPAGTFTLPTGTPFVVEITNAGRQPLYLGLLACWPNGTVEQLYPQVAGAKEALAVNHTINIGLRTEPHWQLRLDLPPGIDQEEITLKLIATHQPTGFDALLQAADEAPVAEQPSTYTDPRQRTRKFILKTTQIPPADWTTAQLKVRLVRAAAQQQVSV